MRPSGLGARLTQPGANDTLLAPEPRSGFTLTPASLEPGLGRG